MTNIYYDETIKGRGTVDYPLGVVITDKLDNILTKDANGHLYVSESECISCPVDTDDSFEGDGTCRNPLSLKVSTDDNNSMIRKEGLFVKSNFLESLIAIRETPLEVTRFINPADNGWVNITSYTTILVNSIYFDRSNGIYLVNEGGMYLISCKMTIGLGLPPDPSLNGQVTISIWRSNSQRHYKQVYNLDDHKDNNNIVELNLTTTIQMFRGYYVGLGFSNNNGNLIKVVYSVTFSITKIR